MNDEKHNENIEETSISLTPKRERAINLKNEIRLHEGTLKSNRRRLNSLFEGGVHSIKDGMKFLGLYPIGLFITTKIICFLTGVGTELFSIADGISLHGSTILGLYLSIPLTGLMFAFSAISRSYHREYETEKRKLEESIEIDTKALEESQAKYAELQKTLTSEDEAFLRDYETRKAQRETEKRTLDSFRNQLLLHCMTDTLEEYLKSIGVEPESIEDGTSDISKIFSLEEKDKTK